MQLSAAVVLSFAVPPLALSRITRLACVRAAHSAHVQGGAGVHGFASLAALLGVAGRRVGDLMNYSHENPFRRVKLSASMVEVVAVLAHEGEAASNVHRVPVLGPDGSLVKVCAWRVCGVLQWAILCCLCSLGVRGRFFCSHQSHKYKFWMLVCSFVLQ